MMYANWHGKVDSAYHQLREINNWFSKGLDTVDLIEAKTFLEKSNIHPES